MENKASSESNDPMKQILILIEKKIRNLEKRKSRLDAIREKARDRDIKAALNEEQKEAIEKYELVIQNIEFVKELQKNVVSLVTDHEKQVKKQQKKERQEKSIAEQKRFRELLEVQSLLESLGDDKIRNDFLHGANGATVLSEEDLNHLDNLYQLISPTRDETSNYEQQLTEAAEHVSSLLDGRDRPVGTTTYQHLHQLIAQIRDSKYFSVTHNGASHDEESQQVEPVKEEVKSHETISDRLATENASSQVPIDQGNHASLAATSFAGGDGANKTLVTSSFGGVTSSSYEPFFPPSSLYQPPPPQRPLQDIVSASPFNFLQDSEIDNDYGSSAAFESFPGAQYHSQALTSVAATFGQAFVPPSHGATSHPFASSSAAEQYSLSTSMAAISLGPSGTQRRVDVEGKKNYAQSLNPTADAFQTFQGNTGALNFSNQSQTFVSSNLSTTSQEGEFMEKSNLPHREQSYGRPREQGGRGGGYGRGRGSYHRDNEYDGRNAPNRRNDNGQRGAHRGGAV